MKKRYIFDTLPTAPDGIEIEGSADIGRIRELVHQGIANGAAPDTGKKRRRFPVLLAAAVAVTAVLIVGSVAVLGKDNYDFNSPEAQAAAEMISDEYNDAFIRYLDEYIETENDEVFLKYGIYAPLVKTEIDQYGKVLDVVKSSGYVNKDFSLDDVYQQDDVFIDACCNAFIYGNLNTTDKTRVYLYLAGRYYDRPPYTNEFERIDMCSQETKDKIKQTLGYSADTNQIDSIGEISILRVTATEDLSAQEIQISDELYTQYYKDFEKHLRELCFQYRSETGIDLNIQYYVNETPENTAKYQEFTIKSMSYATYDLLDKVFEILERNNIMSAEEIDRDKFTGDAVYSASLYKRMAKAVINSDAKLSTKDRVYLEVFFGELESRISFLEKGSIVFDCSVTPYYKRIIIYINELRKNN